MAEAMARGSRITGKQRDALAAEYTKRYNSGESIRAIADDAGRSFGFVHGLLKEAGIELRGRGGATRGTGTAKQAPAKRAPAKRAPAKQAPAKQAPAKRSPAKQAPAKKVAPAQAAGDATAALTESVPEVSKNPQAKDAAATAVEDEVKGKGKKDRAKKKRGSKKKAESKKGGANKGGANKGDKVAKAKKGKKH